MVCWDRRSPGFGVRFVGLHNQLCLDQPERILMPILRDVLGFPLTIQSAQSGVYKRCPLALSRKRMDPALNNHQVIVLTTEHRAQSMKFTVMELYPCSYVLDNVILTLFGCIVRTNEGRELQSSGHAFLLPAPNHTGNLQHTV